MSSNSRLMIVLSAVMVIGIILIGTGLFLLVFDPTGRGTTTTTSTTTTTTSPTTTGVHNPYEIAIVFETGGLGDRSFNDGVYSGATNAHTDYNINFTFSEPSAISDYEIFLREYAAHSGYIEPYDLIISVGFDQDAAIEAVAEDYPDQEFAIIDTFVDPVTYPNVASVLFTENEGSALVGAIAGLTTQADSIGFLGGMDIPLIRKYAAGFVWGANLTNPGILHIEQYTGDWTDTTTGKTLTTGMYSAGLDIVFAVAGRAGLGAFDSAKELDGTSGYENPLWVIGNDVPQMYLGCADPNNPAPPTIGLTSMLKRVDVATYDLMFDAVLGTWASGLKFYDLSNGGHGYEINESLLTLAPSVISTVEMIKTGIINGTFVVPNDVYW